MKERAHAPDAPAAAAADVVARAAQPAAAAELLRLQRAAGNAAVRRMLARRERPGPTPTDPGDWTTDDRRSDTARWRTACEHNLLAGRSDQYITSEERAAFYRWFYIATTTNPDPARRSETRWPLAASIVAAGAWDMVNLPASEGIAREMGITSDEVQTLLRRGNQVIFDNVFAKLRDLWLNPRRGQAAIDWDAQTLAEEQNLIAPLYRAASPAAIDILQNMSSGTWWSARQGARIAASADVRGTVAENIQPGRVPWFSGTLGTLQDRWNYGMRLAGGFSTLHPAGSVPTTAPGVDASYTDGRALAAVDWKPNIAEFEANTDPPVLSGEVERAVAAMKRFSVREQHLFLGEWDRFRQRCREGGLVGLHALEGMAGWTANLPVQIRFIDALGIDWRSTVDYGSGRHDLRPMILAAPQPGRDAVRGRFFRDVFVEVCTNATMRTAVADLGIGEPERSEWLREEGSI